MRCERQAHQLTQQTVDAYAHAHNITHRLKMQITRAGGYSLLYQAPRQLIVIQSLHINHLVKKF